MRVKHTNLKDLAAASSVRRRPWLKAACARLRSMPEHPSSRILVAEEDGQTRAVLGMRLYWGANGRLARAVICVLGVDPEHNRRGIGSRLIRFAEGIARVRGCTRVEVVPDLEGWCEGRCWTGLGYDDPGAGLHKVLGPSGQSYRCEG